MKLGRIPGLSWDSSTQAHSFRIMPKQRRTCWHHVACRNICNRLSKSHRQIAASYPLWGLLTVSKTWLLPTIQLRNILQGKIGIYACVGSEMRCGDGRTIATYCTCSTVFIEQSLTRIALLYSPATMHSTSNAQCRCPLPGQVWSW